MRAETLIVGDGKLHFWIGGNGPPLVLLHSAFADAAFSWERIFSSLEGEFTVVAPDLPGFGRSDPLSLPSLAAIATRLRAAFAMLGLPPAIVVGNSFGVPNALEYATMFPEHTVQVVLVNGAPLPALPVAVRALLRTGPGLALFTRVSRRMFYSRRALEGAFPTITDATEREELFRHLEAESVRAMAVVPAAALSSAPQTLAVRAPVSLVWGAADRMTPLRVAHWLVRRLPAERLFTIDGAGHCPQREKPAEFVARLCEAIRS